MIVRRGSKSDRRLKWFDEARFGMFIHFGVYSLLGRGEWVLYDEKIPRNEYGKLMHRFNPVRFNADRWVNLAKEAGARYIAVTAKHHDGFCLFDSRLTEYKITNTPFKRDLTGELIGACHRKKMRIVLYYSQPDWHHPNYVHRKGAFKDLQEPQPDSRPDWESYLKYLHGQVGELVTRYGRIDGIWFDGSHKTEKEWQGRELYRLIKRHQPGAVVNDRARFGDFFTPERTLPDDLSGYLFEACQSVSIDAWGYKKESELFSVPYLLESLVRVVSKGGNFLLNVGPAPDGTIPEEQASRMRGVGKWLERNGEAVYGTDGCPEISGEQLLATRKSNSVYLFLLTWPKTDKLRVTGIKDKPVHCRFTGSGLRLKWDRIDKNSIVLSKLPSVAPDPHLPVIELVFPSKPHLAPVKPTAHRRIPVKVKSKGITILSAEEALLQGFWVKGHKIRVTRSLVNGKPFSYLSGWLGIEQSASWRISTEKPTRVKVGAELACEDIYSGSDFVIEAGKNRLKGTVPGTGGFEKFRRLSVGYIKLRPGISQIRMQPVSQNFAFAFANVRRLVLKGVNR